MSCLLNVSQEQGSASQMQMCLCLQMGLYLQHTVRRQNMGTPEGASCVAGWHRHCVLTRLLPRTGGALSACAGSIDKETYGGQRACSRPAAGP